VNNKDYKNDRNNENEKRSLGWSIFSGANIFLVFLLAFLVGVIVESLVNISELVEVGLFVLLLISVIVYFFKHTSLKVLMTIALLVGFILGIIRVEGEIDKSSGWVSGRYKGIGTVVKFPEAKNDYQRIYIKIEGKKLDEKNNGRFVKKSETVLLFVSLGINYDYGRKYNIECTLKTPENKYQKFNYIRFLASKKVYQVCSGAKIESIVGAEEFSSRNIINDDVIKVKNKNYLDKLFYKITIIKIYLLRSVYNFRSILENKINQLFPMPESAYLAGLLLGGDNRLPENISENFRRTGTTHTVAVSGYNITILATVFMWIGIGIGLWRKQAFWFVTGCIILFIIMIGAPSSAVRAGVMGVIMLYALQSGRLASSVRIIILTAVIMVFTSPFILLYDVGFQLSFLATLGIILIYGPLAEKIKIENDFLGIKSIVLVTLSAQLGVLGLLIYTFNSISLISLLANVIILPALPLIMLGGAIAVGSSFLINSLGLIFSLPTWMMLHLEIGSINQLAKIPWAIIEFNKVNIWWSLGYYIALSIVLIVIRNRQKEV